MRIFKGRLSKWIVFKICIIWKWKNNFKHFLFGILKIYHSRCRFYILTVLPNVVNLIFKGNFKTSDYTTSSADFVTSSPNSTSGNSSFNTHGSVVGRSDQTCYFYGHQHCWTTPRYHPAVGWIRTSGICSCPGILCDTGKTISMKLKFFFY